MAGCRIICACMSGSSIVVYARGASSLLLYAAFLNSTRPTSDSRLQLRNKFDTATLVHGLICVGLCTCVPLPHQSVELPAFLLGPFRIKGVILVPTCSAYVKYPPGDGADHCGYWFGQTWLFKSFNKTDAMVAKSVKVVAVKV